jgi:hypothetical protein
MKPKHIAAIAAPTLIALTMSACVTETTTNPDGSIKTTKRPDPVVVGTAATLGGQYIASKSKPKTPVITDK